MVELAMASFLPHLLPAISFDYGDKILNLHATSLAQHLPDSIHSK